jgi:hypothetical protein
MFIEAVVTSSIRMHSEKCSQGIREGKSHPWSYAAIELGYVKGNCFGGRNDLTRGVRETEQRNK